jgi:Ser/Thr protein kinase RdoA (MazF antagonist)
VGQRLGRIHSAAAGRADIREAFSTAYIFEPIRIEPYLRAVARRHADLAPQLHALADRTTSRACALTLVHGDVSPKNILIGPDGPVFLDAECAWYGDPAFDIAFCLNHLLLKCLWVPRASDALLEAFRTLWEAYEKSVDWEPKENIAARTATLLPALFLARVDGKSPVEYITDEAQKDRVRRVARELIRNQGRHPDDVRALWEKELERV